MVVSRDSIKSVHFASRQNYADNPEEVTRNFKKDDAQVDAQADVSTYVHVNFIRHAVGIISDARCRIFGNE